MTDTLSQERLALARELVDDVELSRLAPEMLLLKATRLARLVDDTETATWLGWELNGYDGREEQRTRMVQFGRLDNMQSLQGFLQPLAGISGSIGSMQTQIASLHVPNIHFAPSSANPTEQVTGFAGLTATKMLEPAHKVLERLQALTSGVAMLASIRSRVLAAVHDFAVSSYHTLAFSGVAETIFEKHKVAIDALLQQAAPDALDKLPAIYDRLSEGDTEAVSQAMNSVRRMIKAFADSVYPPSDGSKVLDDQRYELGSDKVLNRLRLFLGDRCPSRTRRDRLNRTLRDVHDRASAGSHADITPEEAKALVLQTYLVLGEILTLAPSLAEASIAAPVRSSQATTQESRNSIAEH